MKDAAKSIRCSTVYHLEMRRYNAQRRLFLTGYTSQLKESAGVFLFY